MVRVYLFVSYTYMNHYEFNNLLGSIDWVIKLDFSLW